MITNAASPARNGGTSLNMHPQGETAMPGANWQEQLEEMLRPTIAPLQQRVVQAAEQRLEPLRFRIQQLAEQQLAGAVPDTLQQERSSQAAEAAQGTARTEQAVPRHRAAPSEKERQQLGEAQQQQTAAPSQSLAPAPTTEAPSQQFPEGESALQRWGGTLEELALVVLAVGEVLEGVAVILQAVDDLLPSHPSIQRGQGSEPSFPGEQEQEQGEDRASLFQKLGQVFVVMASALRHMRSRLLGSGSSVQQGLEGMLASFPQWGRILGRASALIQALGESSSSGQGGLSSMKQWGPIIKQGIPLVKELGQVLGGLSPEPGGYGGDNVQRWGQILGRAASVLEALGGDSSQKQDGGQSSGQGRTGEPSSPQEQDNGSSSKQGGGGLSSAVQSLAGGSPQRQGEGGSSLLDALTGESSPLQMLREFSKRQQGPGGLAPKGPIGRKPPPGPLRRDRIPDAK